MENRSKLQKIKSACIILGMLIYFTRLFREDFKGHETILYWLGFIPNFGMSFAFPFMFFFKETYVFTPLQNQFSHWLGNRFYNNDFK
jgi:hypothetical protein